MKHTPTRAKRGIGHNKGPAPGPKTPALPFGPAIIYRPSRSVMTSGQGRTKQWILRFERRRPQYIEPLMGWTADEDMTANVELKFNSLKSAIRFADSQGLDYRLHGHVKNQKIEKSDEMIEQNVGTIHEQHKPVTGNDQVVMTNTISTSE